MSERVIDHASAVAAVLAAQVGKPAELVTGTINWAAYIVRSVQPAMAESCALATRDRFLASLRQELHWYDGVDFVRMADVEAAVAAASAEVTHG